MVRRPESASRRKEFALAMATAHLRDDKSGAHIDRRRNACPRASIVKYCWSRSPSGKLGPEHFRLVEAAVPKPKDGEALVRVRLISLDAANRAWMHGATYRPELETNAVMAGGSIAEVVESKAPGFAVGDLVFGDTGWQDTRRRRASTSPSFPTSSR